MTRASQMIERPLYRLLFGLALFFGIAIQVQAATLSITPAAGSFAVGDVFPVTIIVSSPDQPLNAVEGFISFPTDKLEVASVSKEGSVINLWAQEPYFSNGAGTLNFEGIATNPGFTGPVGKAFRINFRAKATGSAAITFSAGSILANDGIGTNILTNLKNALFTIQPGSQTKKTQAPKEISPRLTEVAPPEAPKVLSPTHPDPTKWYSKKDALVEWNLPSGVTGVRLLLNRSARSTPTVLYEPPVRSKELKDLDDGEWYLHAQFQNAGGWGAISHTRLQIDTEAPAISSVVFPDGTVTDNPRPRILFSSTDSFSGVHSYRIKVNDGSFEEVNQSQNDDSYLLPLQTPGVKDIELEVSDFAGNVRTASASVTITALKPPEVRDYKKLLKHGENLVVSGQTYPNSKVTITARKDKVAGTPDVSPAPIAFGYGGADTNGKWSVSVPELFGNGAYAFTAEVTDSRQAKSPETVAYPFEVKPAAFVRIAKLIVLYTSVGAVILLVLAALSLAVLRSWRFLTLLYFRQQGEIKEVKMKAGTSALLRKKVDRLFSQGDYLTALTGYQRLQEQTLTKKHPELTKKIDLTKKFLLAEALFKKAQAAARQEQWAAVSSLLDNEAVTHKDFIYHDEARSLSEEAATRRIEESVGMERSVALAEQGVEEIRQQLSDEQHTARTLKMKVEQISEEKSAVEHLLVEKEKVLADLQAEVSSAQKKYSTALSVTNSQKTEAERKLADTTRIANEAAENLRQIQGRLKVEQANLTQTEEECKKLTALLAEKETAFTKALADAEAQAAANKQKIADITRLADETKQALTLQHIHLTSEQERRVQCEGENQRLASFLKEKELALEQSVITANMHKAEAEKKISVIEHAAGEAAAHLKQEHAKRTHAEEEEKRLATLLAEKEAALERALLATEKNKAQVAKERDALTRAADEVSAHLKQEQDRFKAEHAKLAQAEEEEKRLAALLAEQEGMLEKERTQSKELLVKEQQKRFINELTLYRNLAEKGKVLLEDATVKIEGKQNLVALSSISQGKIFFEEVRAKIVDLKSRVSVQCMNSVEDLSKATDSALEAARYLRSAGVFTLGQEQIRLQGFMEPDSEQSDVQFTEALTKAKDALGTVESFLASVERFIASHS